MARKGNPISVRLDLNRSSDPSRFSEGESQSKLKKGIYRIFLFLYLLFWLNPLLKAVLVLLYLCFFHRFLLDDELRSFIFSTFFDGDFFSPYSNSIISLPGNEDPEIQTQLNNLNACLSFFSDFWEHDPEWINWMQKELSERTPDGELVKRIQSFIAIEENAFKRKAVIETFINSYYASAYYPVDPHILDASVRWTIDQQHMFWDDASLEEALDALRRERWNSRFFQDVIDGNADFLWAAWQEKLRQDAASLERSQLYQELLEMEQRIWNDYVNLRQQVEQLQMQKK